MSSLAFGLFLSSLVEEMDFACISEMTPPSLCPSPQPILLTWVVNWSQECSQQWQGSHSGQWLWLRAKGIQFYSEEKSLREILPCKILERKFNKETRKPNYWLHFPAYLRKSCIFDHHQQRTKATFERVPWKLSFIMNNVVSWVSEQSALNKCYYGTTRQRVYIVWI